MNGDRLVVPHSIVEAVDALHHELDRAIDELLGRLDLELRCGPGCADCCVDDVTVFQVEAAWMSRGAPLRIGAPAAPGRCAFLDEARRCRIYERRPYVCKTQGLPLRWLDEESDRFDGQGSLIERRDICPLNDPLVALLDLDPDRCWTLGPFEARLAHLQAAVDGGALRRVPLRELADLLASPEHCSGSSRRAASGGGSWGDTSGGRSST